MTIPTMKSSALCSIFLLLPSAFCHMEMSYPYPFRSKYNPANTYVHIDYSMTSPLLADGSNYPCKGYAGDSSPPTAIYTAGSTYNMSLAGSATHGGGSCQLSLSYDNGASFKVIKSMIGGCPLVSTYNFTIPSYAPSGNALLAWSWLNYEGNREFYMNCAPVNIVSGASRRRRRTVYNSFDSLPYIWRANLASVTDCITSPNENQVYPNPGPDVQYANGMDSSSPPIEDDCNAPSSGTQAFQPVNTTRAYSDTPESTTASAATTTSAPLTSTVWPAQGNGTTAPDVANNSYPLPYNPNAAYQRAAGTAGTSSPSTTTITVDECPATITVTITPTVYTASTPSSICSGTSASCPCISGYQCVSIASCEWQCLATPSPSAFTTSASPPPAVTATATPSNVPTSQFSAPAAPATSSMVVVLNTATVSPVPASSPPAQSTTAPTQPQPAYATGDPEAYLPCVPGTFVCTSETTWDTCDYNGGSAPPSSSNSWVYDYPRNVSAGMMCLPYLSPYSSQTDEDGQQAMTQQGYYRDDRIVRARPDGDCSDEGALQCTHGGQSFDICDHGGWVEMGSVASGTTCENGQIVAS